MRTRFAGFGRGVADGGLEDEVDAVAEAVDDLGAGGDGLDYMVDQRG